MTDAPSSPSSPSSTTIEAVARAMDDDWRARLITRGDPPRLTRDPANAITILANHPRWVGLLAWNDMSSDVVALGRLPFDGDDAPATPHKRGQKLEEHDYTRIAAWLARHERLSIGADSIGAAVAIVARARAFHPVRDYLQRLRWDGRPRIASWLTTYMNADGSIYTQHVGRWWMLSAIARVMQPGAKVDTVLILEGPQGLRKSQAIAALAGPDDWFTDHLGPLDSKDTLQQIHGPWIVELAELDGFGRAEISRLKAFFSARIDRFRPPYGRAPIAHPRQNVFCGTVNPGNLGYLRDDTGGRRFWPVKVHASRVDDLRRDRDQLWAEALENYRAGARWWPEAEDRELIGALQDQQEERYAGDEWESLIAGWMTTDAAIAVYRRNAARIDKIAPRDPEAADAIGFFLGSDVMAGALELKPREMGRAEQTRVGTALARLGLRAERPRIESGARPTVYRWPDAPPWRRRKDDPPPDPKPTAAEVVQPTPEKSRVGQLDDWTTYPPELCENDPAELFDRSL